MKWASVAYQRVIAKVSFAMHEVKLQNMSGNSLHTDSSLKEKYLPASWGAGIPYIKTDMVWTLQSSFERSALHPVKSLNLCFILWAQVALE